MEQGVGLQFVAKNVLITSMKIKLSVLALITAFFISVPFGFALDPVEGYWDSIDDKTNEVTAKWHIYADGNTLFGKIVFLVGFDPEIKADLCKGPYENFPVTGDTSSMTIVGTPWIYGLKLKSAGVWTKGNIVDPNDGKLYGCEITYHAPNGKKYLAPTLEMRGKIGPFGRSQFWRKSEQ
jgi:uncharacterized protein (DUF2147 family)